VIRLTANEASASGSAGAIGKSEWNASGTLRASTDALRTIVSARSGPSPNSP
jgi:hypothetical protein